MSDNLEIVSGALSPEAVAELAKVFANIAQREARFEKWHFGWILEAYGWARNKWLFWRYPMPVDTAKRMLDDLDGYQHRERLRKAGW